MLKQKGSRSSILGNDNVLYHLLLGLASLRQALAAIARGAGFSCR
jgi:hypothetical protein